MRCITFGSFQYNWINSNVASCAWEPPLEGPWLLFGAPLHEVLASVQAAPSALPCSPSPRCRGWAGAARGAAAQPGLARMAGNNRGERQGAPWARRRAGKTSQVLTCPSRPVTRTAGPALPSGRGQYIRSGGPARLVAVVGILRAAPRPPQVSRPGCLPELALWCPPGGVLVAEVLMNVWLFLL